MLDLLVPGSSMPYPQSPTLGANGGLPGLAAGGRRRGQPLPGLGVYLRRRRHTRGRGQRHQAQPGQPAAEPTCGRCRAGHARPHARRLWHRADPVARGHGPGHRGRGHPDHQAAAGGPRPADPSLGAAAEPGASGRMEVRVTDTGPRWRLLSDGAVGPWLGLEAPFGTPDGPDPSGWWSIGCDVADLVRARSGCPTGAARRTVGCRAGWPHVAAPGAGLSCRRSWPASCASHCRHPRRSHWPGRRAASGSAAPSFVGTRPRWSCPTRSARAPRSPSRHRPSPRCSSRVDRGSRHSRCGCCGTRPTRAWTSSSASTACPTGPALDREAADLQGARRRHGAAGGDDPRRSRSASSRGAPEAAS